MASPWSGRLRSSIGTPQKAQQDISVASRVVTRKTKSEGSGKSGTQKGSVDSQVTKRRKISADADARTRTKGARSNTGKGVELEDARLLQLIEQQKLQINEGAVAIANLKEENRQQTVEKEAVLQSLQNCQESLDSCRKELEKTRVVKRKVQEALEVSLDLRRQERGFLRKKLLSLAEGLDPNDVDLEEDVEEDQQQKGEQSEAEVALVAVVEGPLPKEDHRDGQDMNEEQNDEAVNEVEGDMQGGVLEEEREEAAENGEV